MLNLRRPDAARRGLVAGTPRFAALDFETADHTPSSACAVGVVIVEDGRIVRRLSRLIRPPGRHFRLIRARSTGASEKRGSR